MSLKTGGTATGMPSPDLSLGLMAAAERRADRVLGWDFSFGV
jgi:hypothetical protein